MTNYSRSVLKSNGYKHPEIRLKKFEFSRKTTFTNITKKLSVYSLLKSIFFRIFNFAHKRFTFAFTSEIEYTLGSLIKIAHSGLHAETRGFTLVQPCRAFDCLTSPKGKAGGSGCTPYGVCPLSSAPQPRWAALPCLQFGDVSGFSLCTQDYLHAQGEGISLSSAHSMCR